MQQWADTTAQIYCSFDTVDGLQIDLEPMTGKYLPNLLVFLERLGQNLASSERHCVDDKHPDAHAVRLEPLGELVLCAVCCNLL